VKAIVGVLIGLAILAGGFGVYRLLSGDDERDRAEAAAADYSAFGRKRCDDRRARNLKLAQWQTPGARKLLDEMTAECKRPYEVRQIEQIDTGLWRFHVREEEDGAPRCLEVDLAEFHVSARDSVYAEGTVNGLSDTACGPEWWTPEYATNVLRDSTWARKHEATLVSCAGVGRTPFLDRASPGRVFYYRRFICRYSIGRSAHAVTLRTTGGTTFDIANPS
jgi:hypothetical protein